MYMQDINMLLASVYLNIVTSTSEQHRFRCKQGAGRGDHKDNCHLRKWVTNFQMSLETSCKDIFMVEGEHFGALSEEPTLWEERFF